MDSQLVSWKAAGVVMAQGLPLVACPTDAQARASARPCTGDETLRYAIGCSSPARSNRQGIFTSLTLRVASAARVDASPLVNPHLRPHTRPAPRPRPAGWRLFRA